MKYAKLPISLAYFVFLEDYLEIVDLFIRFTKFKFLIEQKEVSLYPHKFRNYVV